ncbi:hypothetical protein M9Y10_015632 [Tritrichomonas musculus]|uniref:Uncharacterized protein n=1 Tax=Tritrichomonas musculus TaxID=1915356 RepID=A0ABR2L2T5_9EUKA
MRSIILKSNVFECLPGVYKKCKFVIIPYIEDLFNNSKKEMKRDNYDTYYDLVSRLNYGSKSLMDYSLCLNWLNVLWYDFKYRFDIQQFLSYISEYDDVDELPFKSSDSINKEELFEKKELFFSELIKFILKLKKEDNSLIFGRNKVFINKNKKLVPKSEIVEFNWNKEAKSIIFEWMGIVKYDYKNKMLSDGLKHLYWMMKFDEFPIENSIHAIEDRITETNSIRFMKYVIQGNEKRELMYKFSEKLLDIPTDIAEFSIDIFQSKKQECNIENIINSMFRKADELIFDKLIEKMN